MIGSFKILTCFFDFSKLIDSVKSSDSTRTFVFGFIQFSRILLAFAALDDLYSILQFRLGVKHFFELFSAHSVALTRRLIYNIRFYALWQPLYSTLFKILSIKMISSII